MVAADDDDLAAHAAPDLAADGEEREELGAGDLGEDVEAAERVDVPHPHLATR